MPAVKLASLRGARWKSADRALAGPPTSQFDNDATPTAGILVGAVELWRAPDPCRGRQSGVRSGPPSASLRLPGLLEGAFTFVDVSDVITRVVYVQSNQQTGRAAWPCMLRPHAANVSFDTQAQAVTRQQASLRQFRPAGQLAAAAPAAECASRSRVMRDLRHAIAVQDG